MPPIVMNACLALKLDPFNVDPAVFGIGDNVLTPTNAKPPDWGSPVPVKLFVILLSVIVAGPTGTRISEVQNPARTWTVVENPDAFVIVKLNTLFPKNPVKPTTRLQISKLPVPPVGVGVAIGVGVASGVGVAIDVGVAIGVGVATGVGVGVGTGVGVGVGVATGVGVGVATGVGVGVGVATGVGVGVGVATGVGDGVGIGFIHGELLIVLLSNVTAPFCAKALPALIFAPVFSVILVSARMFPDE